MKILYKSNSRTGIQNHEYINRFIEDQKRQNPAYKVLDVGGAMNPWCKWVDAFVDCQEVSGKKVFVGDVNDSELWGQVTSEGPWDFLICSHLLEDIRNPSFVIEKIQQVAHSGCIAMPNKHTEFSLVESGNYLGYGHHRWIFTLAEDCLLIMPKMPAVNDFLRANYFVPAKITAAIIRRKKKWIQWNGLALVMRRFLKPDLSWFDESLAGHEFELSFIWEGGFDFKYVNGDFSGSSIAELKSLYREALSEGI